MSTSAPPRTQPPQVKAPVPEPATPATAKIDVSGLNFYYGDRRVLEQISVLIRPNEVTALIGPSGCGKSTFLRCLNRMNDHIAGAQIRGRVVMDGEDVYGPDVDAVDLRRRVGMVFQKSNPFPKTIFENVAFGPRVHGLRDAVALREIVERSLRQSALWDEVSSSLEKSALELSGGQQQRLCIARALAVEPEVLLMDEPASALDPTSTAKIEELVLNLRERYTIVVVTHNMQQAARISNRTAFLMQGRLVEVDDTARIFTQPRERLTEDYITGRFG